MQALFRETRFALRRLRLHPGYTASVVLTLALGVGLNGLIFSLVYAVLFRPLPGYDTRHIVIIFQKNSEADNLSAEPEVVKIWRSTAQSFERIEAGLSQPVILTGSDLPEMLTVTCVSPGYFALYRAQAAVGRTFVDGEDEPGRNYVAVLDYDFWQQRFAGDPQVVGKAITLNSQNYTIVGVAAQDFHPLGRRQVPIYLPLVMSDFSGAGVWAAARLKPGVSLPAARAEMDIISARLQASLPQMKGLSANVVPVLETWIAQARAVLLILAACVVLVLLIACANVTNLMLVRTINRQKEFAVKVALGAGRGQLVRQVIVESVMLACLGGVIGLLLAALGIKLLSVINPSSIPRLDELHLDVSVVVITFLIAIGTGLLCSLGPLVTILKQDLRTGLQQEGRGVASGRVQMITRRVLIVSELALTYILVLAAILLVQSFRLMTRADLGFDPKNVLTLRLDSPETKDPEGRELLTFYLAVQDRLKHLPGVESAGYALSLPTGGIMAGMRVDIVGREPAKGIERSAVLRIISPDYLQTLRIPVREGRGFTEEDAAGAQQVAIINESLARRYFSDRSPIGQELIVSKLDPNMREGSDVSIKRRIVGIVGDVKQNSVTDHGITEIYLPLSQNPIRSMYMAIRSKQGLNALENTVAGEIATQRRDVPVSEIIPMEQLTRNFTDSTRAGMMLFSFFGILALSLSTIGVYGLIAYINTLRTREIGIRMALGAGKGRIFLMICRQALWFALIGVVLGVVAYFTCYRLLKTFLFGVTATNPASMLIVAFLLLGVVLLASLIPALRAAKIEPAMALRYE